MVDERSFWDATAPLTSRAPLEGSHSADVVVVGGGIAGASIALSLQDGGRQVVLLEAEEVGRGATGSSTVKVAAAQGLRAHRIAERRGEEDALRYLRASARAVERVSELVREHGIDCGYEARRHVVFAEDADRLDDLRHELDLEQRAGIEARWTDTIDLPFPVAGALVAEHQVSFHPVRYVQGLVEAFELAGGLAFEGSRVQAIDDVEPVRVVTDRGEISARDVVVATHSPIVDDGLLFARLDPQHEYAIAARIEDERAPTEMYINIGSPNRSVRTAEDGGGSRLLIVVGERHKVGEGGDTTAYYAALERWASERFGVGDAAYRWSTHDTFTLDGLPMIGRPSRSEGNIWVATGFGAWGMTNGTIAAEVLSDLIRGRVLPDAELFSPTRGDVARGVASFASMNLKVAVHWVGDRLSTDADDVDELGPGEAAIIRGDGRQIAAFRDDAGAVHAVSAVCTHLGCIVRWNGGDRSWDCPCHGSRFGPDGDVIGSPATEPLERLDDLAP